MRISWLGVNDRSTAGGGVVMWDERLPLCRSHGCCCAGHATTADDDDDHRNQDNENRAYDDARNDPTSETAEVTRDVILETLGRLHA